MIEQWTDYDGQMWKKCEFCGESIRAEPGIYTAHLCDTSRYISDNEVLTINVPPPAPMLTFHFPWGSNEECGRIECKDGVISFTGNADASAQIFIDSIVSRYDSTLSLLRASLHDMVGHFGPYEKTMEGHAAYDRACKLLGKEP